MLCTSGVGFESKLVPTKLYPTLGCCLRRLPLRGSKSKSIFFSVILVNSSKQKKQTNRAASSAVRLQCPTQSRQEGQTHTVLAVETVEDVDKELVNDVHDFIVVLVDGHLKIQSSELTQMPVSEGVFCPAARLTMLNHTMSRPVLGAI